MSHHKTKIVLNGKVYDAHTGKVVAHSSPAHLQSSKPKPKAEIKRRPRSIDGVLHAPKKTGHEKAPHVINSHSQHPPKKNSHAVSHSEHSEHSEHKVAKHVNHHRPQKSHTLMRHVVEKPDTSSLVPALPANIVSLGQQARFKRAQQIQKSMAISRFPAISAAENQVSKKIASLPVAPMPAEPSVKSHEENRQEKHPEHKNHQANHKTRQEQIFEKAMENAQSHRASHPAKQRKHRHNSRKRHFRWASGAMAALLFVGFILYLNVPNMSMYLASNRAGFDAKLPGYSPSGYSFSGPIVYSPGKITVNFSSNTDERNYTVTQQVSNWNSQALLDNFISANNKSYQTYQEKGKTIYIFDESNATWVSGGVWYQLQGASGLNTEQLLKVAGSL